MNRSKQFCVLEAFRKILRQELQYIQQRPDILWQQMYNRLQWVEESVKEYIEPEHRIRNSTGARPWIRFKTPFLESGALIQTFARHSDNVSCCAVSPDGSFFVTASADKTLKIWDFFTGRERATLSGHHHGVNFCAISPDSSFIVSAGIDKTLKVWDASSGLERFTLIGHTHDVKSCAVSPDGTFITSVSTDGTLKIWDTASGLERITLTGHISEVSTCMVSPDGNCLVSQCETNLIIWDVISGQTLQVMPAKGISPIAINPGNNFIVSGSSLSILQHISAVVLEVWDSNTGQALASRHAHIGRMTGLLASPCGTFVVSAGTDKIIKIWDATTWQVRFTLSGHDGEITSLAVSADGAFILSTDSDHILKVWDTVNGREQATIPLSGLSHCIAIHPTLSLAAIGDDHGNVFIMDLIGLDAASRETMPEAVNSPPEYSPYPGKEESKNRPIEKDAGMSRGEQISVLEAFRKTLRRELHNVKERPDILWQQMYNRLQWEDAKQGEGAFAKLISPELKRRTSGSSKPWFHNKCRIMESEAFVRLLKGHTDEVHSCVFSPDGCTLASTSGSELELMNSIPDNTIRLWDVYTGNEIAVLKGHHSGVNSCAFSYDGRILVSASSDKTVRLWNVLTSEEIAVLKGHTSFVKSCAFSPDGQTLASTSYDNTVRLWNAPTGEEIVVLKGHTDSVICCAFSHDGRMLVSVSSDKTVRLWNVHTGEEIMVLNGHSGWVTSCDFSPDGHTLVSASSDKTVRLWNVNTGNEIAVLKGHNAWVTSCAFSHDGRILVSACSDKTVRLWNALTGEEILTLKGHTSFINSCAFSPDGQTLVSASSDETVRLWDARFVSHLNRAVFMGQTNKVNFCVFSPDGQTLASNGHDETVKLWNAHTGEEIEVQIVHTKKALSCAFSPDGCTLASASVGKRVRLYDAHTGKDRWVLRGHAENIFSCTFSPDGCTLATVSDDRTVRLWDTQTGQERVLFKGHTDVVNSCAFSPDGRTLASASGHLQTFKGSPDTTVRLWDVSTGDQIAILKGHTDGVTSCAFSLDGQTLASTSYDKTVRLWDVSTGSQIAILKGHTAGVSSCAFSPVGRTLASAGSDDNTVRLWDTQTGAPIDTFPCIGKVNTCSFSPLGKTLAAGDQGGNVYILELIGFAVKSFEKDKEAISEESYIKQEMKNTTGLGVEEGQKDVIEFGKCKQSLKIEELKRMALLEEKNFFLFLEQKLSTGHINEVKPDEIGQLVMGTPSKPTAIHQLFMVLVKKEEQHRLEASKVLFFETSRSLSKYASDDNDLLTDCLQLGILSDSFTTRNACFWAAFKVKGADAFDTCSLVFLNPNLEVRLAYAGLFGFLKDKRATPGLVVALKHEHDPQVKSVIINSLGCLEDSRAVAVLTGCLNDTDEKVCGQAVWALGQIGGPEVVHALDPVSKDENRSLALRTQAVKSMLIAAFKTRDDTGTCVKQKMASKEEPTRITCKCGQNNPFTNKWCSKCGREL